MGRRRKDGAIPKSSLEKLKAPKPRKKTEAAKAKLVEDEAKLEEGVFQMGVAKRRSTRNGRKKSTKDEEDVEIIQDKFDGEFSQDSYELEDEDEDFILLGGGGDGVPTASSSKKSSSSKGNCFGKKGGKRAMTMSPQMLSRTKRKEKLRTEEFCKAFDKLKAAIPIHPKDQSAMKLSRLEILRRTIKYIRCLQDILDYLDSEEGVEERRRRLEELRAEEAVVAGSKMGTTEVLMTLPLAVTDEPPSFMQATEVIQLDEAQLAQHEVVGEVVELRHEEGQEQPTYICITLGQ